MGRGDGEHLERHVDQRHDTAGATSGSLLASIAPSMNDSNAIRFTVTAQPLPVSWLDQDVGVVGLRECRLRERDVSRGGSGARDSFRQARTGSILPTRR